jgi:hypothetical protein
MKTTHDLIATASFCSGVVATASIFAPPNYGVK